MVYTLSIATIDLYTYVRESLATNDKTVAFACVPGSGPVALDFEDPAIRSLVGFETGKHPGCMYISANRNFEKGLLDLINTLATDRQGRSKPYNSFACRPVAVLADLQ